jgi:urea carboxylase
VATPLDPRHRLVTTKYNPARTWTPENAVGIGGAYLCVYGMEGPGGYQFVGRTVQMWNRFRQTREFTGGQPWLLRFFDQIRFFPVSAEELLQMREAFPLGRYPLRIEETSFRLGEYKQFLADHADSIESFRKVQQQAFGEERERWARLGYNSFQSMAETVADFEEEKPLPPNSVEVVSPVAGSVWQLNVQPGEKVDAGQPIAIIESMKMEITVHAHTEGMVVDLPCEPGTQLQPGRRIAVIQCE